MTNKRVSILVGPKGAGKSFVGALLAKHFDLVFLRVEPIFLEVIREQGRGPNTDAEGYRRVRVALEEQLEQHDHIVIESTAASELFAPFVNELRGVCEVRLLAVRAPLEECAQRVKSRDQTNHIPVSDDIVEAINARAALVQLAWDAALDNSGPARVDEIIAWFARAVGATSTKP